MFQNIFGNIPDVTKNLLILNVLFFLGKYALESQGINASHLLGMHYPASEFFEPYQIVTHFFMHGDFFHILFNMIGLVAFGSQLERIWGKQRFLIFYMVTAFGAAALHTLVQGIEIYNLIGEWFPDIQLIQVDGGWAIVQETATGRSQNPAIVQAGEIMLTPVVGASGAIYGLLMAFALLFPNTELQLLFPPIPIKAKWLALMLVCYAVYKGYMDNPTDSVAHFAHLGGMLFGFILIQIWKRDKQNFY